MRTRPKGSHSIRYRRTIQGKAEEREPPASSPCRNNFPFLRKPPRPTHPSQLSSRLIFSCSFLARYVITFAKGSTENRAFLKQKHATRIPTLRRGETNSSIFYHLSSAPLFAPLIMSF